MTGNVAFMFVCTIMVFFMTPGLAFFYGGMVRRKNALNTMMFCMAMMGIGMLLWFLCGYSLSFGKDHAGIIGDLNNVLMWNVSWEVTGGEGDAPEMVSALFNMMFAVISPAIILGAVAERMKFSKMMLFVVIWSFLVYYPLAHMAWGGGLLEMIGSIDFAGGNVIHISTGVSGLTACIILGSRKGCWVRTVANADTPALWLLDMIRRAASGLPQAAGTIWQKYGRAIPTDALTAQRLPDKPEPDAPTAAPRKRHRVRNALIFLLILALAAFAAAWYYTGGDLAALPQQLQSLGADSLPHAGAKLI